MSNPTRPTISSTPETPPRQQYFSIISDGLAPEFQPGDHVLVEYGHPVESGDYALVSFGDTFGLFQVYLETAGYTRLAGPENVTLPESEVTILGRVMQGHRIYPSQSIEEVK